MRCTPLAFAPAALAAVIAIMQTAATDDRAATGLVGLRVDELSSRLAPPTAIRGSNGSRWIWESPGGDSQELWVVAGRVVKLSESFDAEAIPAPGTAPAGPYLGQPLVDLLAGRGPADSVTRPPVSPGARAAAPTPGALWETGPRLVWGDLWVTVADDVVVSITPPLRLPPASGPR